MVTLKTAGEAAKMREAGKIVAEMLSLTRAAATPGVSTAELDMIYPIFRCRTGEFRATHTLGYV